MSIRNWVGWSALSQALNQTAFLHCRSEMCESVVFFSCLPQTYTHIPKVSSSSSTGPIRCLQLNSSPVSDHRKISQNVGILPSQLEWGCYRWSRSLDEVKKVLLGSLKVEFKREIPLSLSTAISVKIHEDPVCTYSQKIIHFLSREDSRQPVHILRLDHKLWRIYLHIKKNLQQQLLLLFLGSWITNALLCFNHVYVVLSVWDAVWSDH